MSASSLRSSRNITPIENPDIMEFFDDVHDTTFGGVDVRADDSDSRDVEVDTNRHTEDRNNHSSHQQDLSPPPHDKQDLLNINKLDKNRGEEDIHFKGGIPQKILQVKSKTENDSDDIYDFGYINTPGDGYTNSTDDGYTNATDDGYTNAPGDGYTNATDDGYTNSTDDGYTNATDDGYTNATGDGYTNAPGDGYTNATDNGKTNGRGENFHYSSDETQRRVLKEVTSDERLEGDRADGSDNVKIPYNVKKHVHYSDEVVSGVISYSPPHYGETDSLKDTDNETDFLRRSRGESGEYEMYDDTMTSTSIEGDQNRSVHTLKKLPVQKTHINFVHDQPYYERESNREYDSKTGEYLNNEDRSNHEDGSDQEDESNPEDNSNHEDDSEQETNGEQLLGNNANLISGTADDTVTHENYIRSENQGVDFEDSVENSYFAMFKSSEDSIHVGTQGDKHDVINAADQDTKLLETKNQSSPNKDIHKVSAVDHLNIDNKHTDDNGDETDFEKISNNKNDNIDGQINVKVDDHVSDRLEDNADDGLDNRDKDHDNDHLENNNISVDNLGDHLEREDGTDDLAGHQYAVDQVRAPQAQVLEKVEKETNNSSIKTSDDVRDDNDNFMIENNETNDVVYSQVAEEEKVTTGNNETGAEVNKEDILQEKISDIDVHDTQDAKHKSGQFSAQTHRISASAHSKSGQAHHHKALTPHKPIEEMKAVERLKYAPYNENLARGYSKHVTSSAGAPQSGQHSGKQKKQRKSGAEHPTGSEAKLVEHRRKTEDSASLKKEKTPRVISGKSTGQDRLKSSQKGKKNLPKRKDQTTSNETKISVSEPKTSISVSEPNTSNSVSEHKTSNSATETKANEEHLNDFKEPLLTQQETANRTEVNEETLTVTEITSEVRSDVTEQAALLENVQVVNAELPDKNKTDLKSETREEVKTDGLFGEGDSRSKNDKTVADDNSVAGKRDDKTETNQDAVKNMSGKNNEEVLQGADKNSKNKATTQKQKELTGAAKSKGGENRNPGIRNWFGGNKKKNQGDNSSSKYTNISTPRSTRSVNGIIITTEPPKNEKVKQEVSEVPAALAVVDETKADPHGKAGRLVLANIKQKLKDSSLSGSLNSTPSLPINPRSRSPSPETSFSSNGSKLGKMAHKTQSMSSLQVPGAVTTPRDSGQDEDNVSLSSRRDSGSRKSIDYRIQNVTATIVPESTDEKPKSVLTSEETFIKNAIPYMPLSLAIVCLILNIIIPGSGTALSGLSILCCGQARVSNKNDQILTTLCANCMVGLAQLFTVTFLLVGWFWSIGWGIQMVSLSVQRREEMKKQRAKELQALALSAFGSPKRGAPFGP